MRHYRKDGALDNILLKNHNLMKNTCLIVDFLQHTDTKNDAKTFS